MSNSARGDDATAFSCEERPAAQLDVAAWDVLGITFPVHSSFAAPVFRGYLEQLPRADKPLFAVTTAGIRRDRPCGCAVPDPFGLWTGEDRAK